MNGQARCRVVIVDDHPLVLRGMVELLQTEFVVVAACGSGQAALEAIATDATDVLILDLSMPVQSGIDVLKDLRRENSRIRVLLLTAAISDEEVSQAVALNANGIVLKDATPDEIVVAIRRVADGEEVFPRELIESAQRERSHLAHLEEVLSPREYEIVSLVSNGLSNKLVARELGLAEGTVKVHLHAIYRKTGVENRTSLAVLLATRKARYGRS